jgi:hypothetical protein
MQRAIICTAVDLYLAVEHECQRCKHINKAACGRYAYSCGAAVLVIAALAFTFTLRSDWSASINHGRASPVTQHSTGQMKSSLKMCYKIFPGSRDSVVYIATVYGVDDRDVGDRVPVGSSIFSPPRRPDQLWGPPSLMSNGYLGFFPRGEKRPGREAGHMQLVPGSRNVDLYIYRSIPPYAFMA